MDWQLPAGAESVRLARRVVRSAVPGADEALAEGVALPSPSSWRTP